MAWLIGLLLMGLPEGKSGLDILPDAAKEECRSSDRYRAVPLLKRMGGCSSCCAAREEGARARGEAWNCCNAVTAVTDLGVEGLESFKCLQVVVVGGEGWGGARGEGGG